MKREAISELNKWKTKGDRKPLVLRGARQVGKTYLLQQFGQAAFEKVHYCNFELGIGLQDVFEGDLVPVKILSRLELKLGCKINPNSDLILFDEIQACPKALTSLKYFCEEMPELAICSAGSLLGVMLSKESFPVGKVEFLDLYPMSFREFLLAQNEDRLATYLDDFPNSREIPAVAHKMLWEQLKIYLIVGGLPEVILKWLKTPQSQHEAFSLVRQKQQDLVTAYQSDMAKHCGKVNAMHLNRLWANIPNQLAQSQDGSGKKFKFKDVIPKLKGYDKLAGIIDWLIAAGLVIKVPIAESARLPLSAFCKENTFKLYIFDTGLLGALSALNPATIMSYDYGTYKGYFAENFITQELRTAGHNLYSWKENESELEFLLDIGGKLTPIEVKSGGYRRSRSLSIFSGKYKPSKLFVYSADKPEIKNTGMNRLPIYAVAQIARFGG